jgi:hypothetical protein
VPFVCPLGHTIKVPCDRASWGRHLNAGTCKNHRCPGRHVNESICFNFFYKDETIKLGDVTLPVGDPKLPGFFDAVFALDEWPVKEDDEDNIEIASLIDMDKLKDMPWDVTKHEWVNIPKTKMPRTPAGLVLRTIQLNTNMQGQLINDYQEDDDSKPWRMGDTFLRLTDDRLPTTVVFEFDKEGRMLMRLGGQNGKVWLTIGEECDMQSPEWPIEMFMEKGTNVINLMLNLEKHI